MTGIHWRGQVRTLDELVAGLLALVPPGESPIVPAARGCRGPAPYAQVHQHTAAVPSPTGSAHRYGVEASNGPEPFVAASHPTPDAHPADPLFLSGLGNDRHLGDDVVSECVSSRKSGHPATILQPLSPACVANPLWEETQRAHAGSRSVGGSSVGNLGETGGMHASRIHPSPDDRVHSTCFAQVVHTVPKARSMDRPALTPDAAGGRP